MRFPLLQTLVLVILTIVLPAARSQETLADTLYLRFLPANEAAIALTPPAVVLADTAIVVRYTLIGGIAIYEARAACHPTALSFFGVKDEVPETFCTPDNNAILASYTTYVALVREFPEQVESYAVFLREQGLEPVSDSTDRSTLNGWANFAGNRLADYFASDGWNSLGDVNRQFNRVPFEDYTGYRPTNGPYVPPVRLRRPLRWQPLEVQLDPLGRTVHQVHVVPHIGIRAKTLVLRKEDITSRRPAPPYENPNVKKHIFGNDRALVRRFLKELLNISARLTPMQRFLAQWWNNKLASNAGISAFYEFDNNLTPFEAAQQFMGEMMAQHDALLITWREKRRNDLVRPRTLLQHFRPGATVRGFVDEQTGVRNQRAEDWRPFLTEQPHSEFPSASAALCAAALEHIEEYHKTVKGGLGTFKVRYPPGSVPFDLASDVTVALDSPVTAVENCAESRLWAGVHFRPAIDAGRKIGTGIGKIVLEHVLELGKGNVPRGCERCISSDTTPGTEVVSNMTQNSMDFLETS